MAGDRSTGIHPGHARIDASDNRGTWQIMEILPRNPLVADDNSIQQMRT